MPDRKKLEEQVEILRGQLEQEPPLSEEKREALEALIAKFELQLELEPATQTPSISDDVNQAAIEFDADRQPAGLAKPAGHHQPGQARRAAGQGARCRSRQRPKEPREPPGPRGPLPRPPPPPAPDPPP